MPRSFVTVQGFVYAGCSTEKVTLQANDDDLLGRQGHVDEDFLSLFASVNSPVDGT